MVKRSSTHEGPILKTRRSAHKRDIRIPIIRVVLVTIGAAACRHVSTPAVNAVYPVVSVDSRVLVTNHLSNDAHVERTLSRAATGDTTERESVVTRIDEIVQSAANGSTMLRVSTGHYSGGDYYDSIFVRRGDLRPVREHLAYLQARLISASSTTGASFTK